MRYSVLVEVQLRPGISDPQGQTIERALPALGLPGASAVRAGKAIRFDLDADSEDAARQAVDDICRRFLTNPVIEDATVTLEARV
ncbi:MAG: phosphoribosylformylglycinamidine synthase subunit PurS [Acidimicrobiales bacterium]